MDVMGAKPAALSISVSPEGILYTPHSSPRYHKYQEFNDKILCECVLQVGRKAISGPSGQFSQSHSHPVYLTLILSFILICKATPGGSTLHRSKGSGRWDGSNQETVSDLITRLGNKAMISISSHKVTNSPNITSLGPDRKLDKVSGEYHWEIISLSVQHKDVTLTVVVV